MKLFKTKTTYVAIIALVFAICFSLVSIFACPITASADTINPDSVENEYGIAPLKLTYSTPLELTATDLGSGRYEINVFVDVKPSSGNVTYVDQVCIYWRGYTVEENSAKYNNRWYSGVNGTGTKRKGEDEGSYSKLSASSYICFPLDLKAYFFNGLKRYDCDSCQLTAKFIIRVNGDTKSRGLKAEYLHKNFAANFNEAKINVTSDGNDMSLSGVPSGSYSVTDQVLLEL